MGFFDKKSAKRRISGCIKSQFNSYFPDCRETLADEDECPLCGHPAACG
ncbi:MAG: hypothetical protein HDT42_06505 [Ruminococcaceae bacterium]|nr:hypothetical protein [Oscillospiraceae bacterium]